MPADLPGLARQMLSENPDFVKIAATPKTAGDLKKLLDLQRELGARAVVVAMGGLGAAARILAARLGAPWTYAAAAGAATTAPGQFGERSLSV